MLTHVTQQKRSRAHTLRGGFTLVEMMVSLAIFAIVIVISVGSLLVMIDLNAKAQALYSATTNLSFALDSMTRELRTGYHYFCDPGLMVALPSLASPPTQHEGNDCVNGKSISFIRERDDWQIGYRFNSGATPPRIEQRINNPAGATGDTIWLPITSDDVYIDSMQISVSNSEPYYPNVADSKQPTIEISVSGHVNNGLDTDTDFNIQSHVVQHRLDTI
jgi:prepilin-type N-terminal cleavage/methylation domain-containing protein